MNPTTNSFEAGQLWSILAERRKQALQTGALQPISTIEERVEESGVNFHVRQVSSLARKAAATARGGSKAVNPFLPYEPEMYVADVTATHVALLNKYPVFDHHLLIVTRTFEAQTAPLTLADFSAWWRCLREYPALGFYNGGAEAGASQAHKHLQLVPLPLSPHEPQMPVQALIAAPPADDRLHEIPAFEFRHALLRWRTPLARACDETGSRLLEHYQHMMAALGLYEGADATRARPYNLLLTGEWMLLVGRRHERCKGISVNALAYAGSLLAKDLAQLECIRRVGPMTLLRETALSSI